MADRNLDEDAAAKASRRGRAVPSGRFSRIARFGGMASGIAGNVLLEGAGRFARGERPRLADLLLTPGNVTRATDELARLRGAAMKLGQLVSMDAGELLPPELAEIMARLRAEADPMPLKQLEGVLKREWGPDWRTRFEYFSHRPIAAASIGQVHRALTPDGRDLAIKVQYPGVRRSIDSDVDNVASLMRYTGLVPRDLDLSHLLTAAKAQLHEEADYEREADCLTRFGALLRGDDRFTVPQVIGEHSTPSILAMTYADSDPFETAFTAGQGERDRIATALIDLSLRELFEFGFVQTDPNLANYRIEKATGRLVLLDFGAARAFGKDVVEPCRALLRAAREGDREKASAAILAMGLSSDKVPAERHLQILDMFEAGSRVFRRAGPIDFGDDTLFASMRDEALKMTDDRNLYLIPPADPLFLQRKFAGLALIALKLRARVDLEPLLANTLD